MGLPIVLMFIFLGKGVSLEGSEDGIKEYIGIWDMSVLKDQGDVWSTAVSQIFFSLSVTFGIMTAYGSHLPRDEPAFFNSCTVAICNCLFSFISGFAVFAALGHLACKYTKSYLRQHRQTPTNQPFFYFCLQTLKIQKLPNLQLKDLPLFLVHGQSSLEHYPEVFIGSVSCSLTYFFWVLIRLSPSWKAF